ncbi:hypothetical protein JS562_53300, partial [Agrobacterium sp. S2]|nr:hypothetical protein [Agrobacterium sp. S2]
MTIAVVGVIGVEVLFRLRAVGWRILARAAGAGAILLALVAAVPATVARTNDAHYGVALTDDYNHGSFAEAVLAWSSVEAPDRGSFTIVSESQREAVYRVSPLAASMRSTLENPVPWIDQACGRQAKVPVACDDYIGYFGWSLRDAAMSARPITTAAEFQDFFAQLADEIETACSDGRLVCGTPANSVGIPSLDRISTRTVAAHLFSNIGGSLSFVSGSGITAPPPEDLDISTWLDVVNGADTSLAAVEAANQQAAINLDPV